MYLKSVFSYILKSDSAVEFYPNWPMTGGFSSESKRQNVLSVVRGFGISRSIAASTEVS